jgi:hypothetical protein
MVAPVVIDLGVADAPRESIQVLVDACTQAAADTECHLVRDAPQGPYAAIAIVTWEVGDRIRIEVGVRRAEGAEWRSRELTFQPGDVEVERYKSVGFVIGTLATAEDADNARRPAEAPSREAPLPVEPPLKPLEPAPSEPLKARSGPTPLKGWVSVSAVAARAVSEGAPRLGGSLRVGVRLVSSLSVMVSAGASSRPRDERGLLLSWLDTGIGLGVALGSPSSSRVELRLDALLERLSAEARSSSDVDAAGRTQPAARLGADVVWQLTTPFALVLGAEGLVRPSGTRFRVGGVDAGSVGVLEVGGALGARLDL